ncbi:MAG: TrkA family potassium uptake protein [Eggerthellales bacterium]|nr:TrkA family potassium uptake protein [Eggerthellales bacterium]
MYVIIAGGGKVGRYLASVLLESGNEVVVIENNPKTVTRLSAGLEGSYMVIEGDCCDSRFQEDAGVRRADVFVAATGADDINLMACEIALRVFHVPRCIARVNNPKNQRVFQAVGIESVSSTPLIASLIEEEALLGGMSAITSLTNNSVALAEVTPQLRRHVEGIAAWDVPTPEDSLIVAVINRDGVEVASDETMIMPGDKVVVMATTDAMPEVRAALRDL